MKSNNAFTQLKKIPKFIFLPYLTHIRRNVTQLLSKTQYKRSEKGEFHEIAYRSLDETISLIHNYPWDTERSLASVELTCPSITIEHPKKTYLKIGPYFSGKYCLYYLGTNNQVKFKTVNTIQNACEWVKIYFQQQGKLEGFKNYSFTIRPASHFVTNSFEYTTNTNAVIRFFILPIILLLITTGIIGLIFICRPDASGIFSLMGLMLAFFCVSFSPMIYLYFNYSSADKDYYLRISRGHEEFTYGTKDNRKSYNKQTIARIETYKNTSPRNPWGECQVYTITFKDGEQICFTSLLISGTNLLIKFPDNEVSVHHKFFPTVESVGQV